MGPTLHLELLDVQPRARTRVTNNFPRFDSFSEYCFSDGPMEVHPVVEGIMFEADRRGYAEAARTILARGQPYSKLKTCTQGIVRKYE